LCSCLGELAKSRKATISFVMSVCPSACNNSAPTGQIFVKFDIRMFYENLSPKMQVHFKFGQLWWYFTWTTIFIISRSIPLRMRNISEESYREDQKTHFIFGSFIAKIEQLRDKEDGPQMTIWGMRIACWIHKSTNTHSECVIVIALSTANNGCTNAPQCYVIRTLPVIFQYVLLFLDVLCLWVVISSIFLFLCFPYNERFGCSVSILVIKFGTELQCSVTARIYFNSFLFFCFFFCV
jgi:hypothetical protein